MQTQAVEVYLYDRRSAPLEYLSRTMASWIAVVAPSVTLEERAELRRRGCAVFDLLVEPAHVSPEYVLASAALEALVTV